MDIQVLKSKARQRLEAARFAPRRLALIFTGVGVGVSFLMTLVSFILSRQIGMAGGLGGLGLRTALSVAQILLMLAGTLATPFWNLGYTKASLETARGGDARPRTLLEGFRLFFPAVRLFFAQGALVILLILIAVQGGTMLFLFSPFSHATMQKVQQLLGNGTALPEDPAVMGQLMEMFWPVYLVIALVLLALLIPVMYRMRLVEFSLVDGQEQALRNMLRSNRLMRGKCWAMFRLDLSFWWYFLLQGLAGLVAYGDTVVGGDVAFWAFYLVSAAAQLAISWAFLPRVQVTYGLCYDKIIKEEKKEGQVL